MDVGNKEGLAPEGETKAAETETPAVEESAKLSRMDALEVALTAEKDAEPEVKAGGSVAVETSETRPEDKPIDAPNWMSKEEKEAFRSLDKTSQGAILRIDKSREATRNELDRRSQEVARQEADLKWVKDIHGELERFYKVRGDKAPSAQDIAAALKFTNQYGGDPKAAALGILQADGVELPKELAEQVKPKSHSSPENSAVLEKLNVLEARLAQRDQAEASTVLQKVWDSFEQTKNAAGGLRYPDLQGDSETTIKVASQVGSLVGGQSPLSQDFIRRAKERIPDLSYERLLEEAYRYVGGTIDDSTAPKSHDPQKHLQKSNRAASSVPGRGLNGITTGGTVKKLPRLAALQKGMGDVYGN